MNFETISLIYLSIAYGSQKESISFQGISDIADGINHAIPTQQELRNSITWLIDKQYIIKLAKKYQLTEKGIVLMNFVANQENSTNAIWKTLQEKLSQEST